MYGIPSYSASHWRHWQRRRPEFRERVAAEVGLFRADVGPNGPNSQKKQVA